VKSLAEESQQNAAEIEQLVSNIKSDTDDTVDSIEHAKRPGRGGHRPGQRCGRHFGEIDEAVREEAAQGAEEVASATDEQAASTEEVASMIDMTAESAEEVAEEMSRSRCRQRQQAAKVNELQQIISER